MHTLWVREHNRVARELKKVNPNWNDDLLFLTTRKIVGAIWQHIVYTEFLPNLIKLEKFKNYNPNTDPSIINGFAHAAFRFGHSLVPDQFEQLDKGYNEKIKPVLLQQAFRNRNFILSNGIEGTMFGLLKNTSRPVDNKFAFSLSRRLFVPVGSEGHRDLTALNIQRGREHGLPGYNEYRRLCGLKTYKRWSLLSRIMVPGAWEKLQKVYDTTEDIDLFAGAMSEKYDPDVKVGPLFSCIISRQFKNLRDGDRFYYENKDVFTPSQLKEIKKVTLSTVLCNNLKDIVSIQPHALLAVGEKNIRKSCKEGNVFKNIDFKFWHPSLVNDERERDISEEDNLNDDDPTTAEEDVSQNNEENKDDGLDEEDSEEVPMIEKNSSHNDERSFNDDKEKLMDELDFENDINDSAIISPDAEDEI